MKELFTMSHYISETDKTKSEIKFTTDEPREYDAALAACRQILDGKHTPAARRRESDLVYICSPYRGDTERNIQYAQQLVGCALQRGWTPICPHLYLPQILDDNKPEEREQALRVGLELLSCCDMILVGTMYGISEGMQAEIDRAEALGIPQRYSTF